MITSAPCQIPYRPFFQSVVAPAKLIVGIFLQAVGYLLLALGLSGWGQSLKDRGAKLDSSAFSLLTGLWAYGRRFLVHSDNFESVCRGSCYYFVHKALSYPELDLEEIALDFDDSPPEVAVGMHQREMMPANLEEQKIWEVEAVHEWPPMPDLDPGAYTFVIGYSRDARHPGKAHRIAFFRKEELTLFDPNTGLSQWMVTDWEPLLDRIASSVRENKGGFFTLRCYRHSLRDPQL